jgi:carbon-monoxide dehydrogenase large subunit/6-hydroxypseudooxynicotine dehydrogenase subunit gamma
VKWVEDRREHFLAINHSREQQWTVVAAADERGRLLALDASLVNVMGGYLRTHGVWPASLTASYLPGVSGHLPARHGEVLKRDFSR